MDQVQLHEAAQAGSRSTAVAEKVRAFWLSPAEGARTNETVGAVTSGVTVKVVELLPMLKALSRAKSVSVKTPVLSHWRVKEEPETFWAEPSVKIHQYAATPTLSAALPECVKERKRS